MKAAAVIEKRAAPAIKNAGIIIYNILCYSLYE